MASKVVTVRDIAEVTGFHFTTVSSALRGKGRISDRTRETIIAAAKELGYKSNPAISALMAHRDAARATRSHYNLGFIIPDKPQTRNATFKNFFREVKEHTQNLGYALDLYRTSDFKENSPELEKLLDNKGVSGLIFYRTTIHDFPEHFSFEKYSAVTLGHRILNFTNIVSDPMQRITLAFENILRMGYKRPGLYVKPNTGDRFLMNLLGGYLYHQYQLPPDNRIPPYYQMKRLTFKGWLKRHRPDIILSMDTLPEKTSISIGNLDCKNKSQMGIREGTYTKIFIAIDLLIEMVEHNMKGSPKNYQTIVVESYWQNGKSFNV